MNSRERVMNRLEGKKVDRIPNMNIIMQFASRKIGVPYSEYVQDYNKLVEGNIVCCREYGIDVVSCISDPAREAHDMGSDVSFPYDGVPYCSEHLIKGSQDILDLKIIEPKDGKRMNDRVKAIELYKKEVGEEFAILGWAEGVFAEAADLRGINNIMMDIMTEPQFCEDLFEKIIEQQILFVRAQIEAGADIIGVGDAAASLIGPELYRKIVLPYEKRMKDEIHKYGKKMKFHICGNINTLLPDIKLMEPDVLDIDYYVDFKEAIKMFSDTKTCISGNQLMIFKIQHQSNLKS